MVVRRKGEGKIKSKNRANRNNVQHKRYQRKIEEKRNNKKTNRFTDILNNRKQKNTDR